MRFLAVQSPGICDLAQVLESAAGQCLPQAAVR